MGVVYLAKDPSIGRLVAIKTIRPNDPADDDSQSREFRERFTREAQTAGILSHPNIVTIYDVGEDTATGSSFIAMEYIEGKTIKALLLERKDFPPEHVADMMGQVAEALDYAHRKGIIHRDIKPANIMITTDGRVKITDFGIAKVASSTLTTTGQFLGTPNYMSPEQVTGAAVDGRSDIFSLGVVLYEMLSHHKPFAGENLTTISYKIVHENHAPLPVPSGRVPEEFDPILSRALAKDPWNRYQRGKDMALALYQAKARFEEESMFQDLGVAAAAAENLPTMKMENLSELARRGTPSALDDGATAITVAVPPFPGGGEVGSSTGTSASRTAREPFPERTGTGTSAEKLDGSSSAARRQPPSYGLPEPELEPSLASATGGVGSASPSPEGEAPAPGTGNLAKTPASAWKARVNPRYAWGIVGVVVLIVIIAIAALKMLTPSAKEPPAAEAENAATLQINNELAQGKALLQKGNYAGALALFQQVLQKDPSVPEARADVQKAQQAIAQQQAAALKLSQTQKTAAISAALEGAKTALHKRDYAGALQQAQAALAIDSQNADALKLSEEARRRLDAENEAQQRRHRRGERVAQEEATPAPAAVKPTAPARTVAPNTPASLRISFDVPVPKGFFMVAVNDTILLRRNFDFGKEKHGLVTGMIHAAPGASTIKLWLTTPDPSVKGYMTLPAQFKAGDSRSLTVTFGGNHLAAHIS